MQETSTAKQKNNHQSSINGQSADKTKEIAKRTEQTLNEFILLCKSRKFTKEAKLLGKLRDYILKISDPEAAYTLSLTPGSIKESLLNIFEKLGASIDDGKALYAVPLAICKILLTFQIKNLKPEEDDHKTLTSLSLVKAVYNSVIDLPENAIFKEHFGVFFDFNQNEKEALVQLDDSLIQDITKIIRLLSKIASDPKKYENTNNRGSFIGDVDLVTINQTAKIKAEEAEQKNVENNWVNRTLYSLNKLIVDSKDKISREDKEFIQQLRNIYVSELQSIIKGQEYLKKFELLSQHLFSIYKQLNASIENKGKSSYEISLIVCQALESFSNTQDSLGLALAIHNTVINSLPDSAFKESLNNFHKLIEDKQQKLVNSKSETQAAIKQIVRNIELVNELANVINDAAVTEAVFKEKQQAITRYRRTSASPWTKKNADKAVANIMIGATFTLIGAAFGFFFGGPLASAAITCLGFALTTAAVIGISAGVGTIIGLPVAAVFAYRFFKTPYPKKKAVQEVTASARGNLRELKAVLKRYQMEGENGLPSKGAALRRAAEKSCDNQCYNNTPEEDIKLLVTQYNTKIDGQDEESGDTALHRACNKGNTDAVKQLIRLRADCNIKNAQDKTPLEIAHQDKKEEITQILSKNNSALDTDTANASLAAHC